MLSVMLIRSNTTHPAQHSRCTMHSCMKQSFKYLVNIGTSQGGVTKTIKSRRNKGWGKVASIMGILSEMDMGIMRVEVWFLMRKATLVNSLLFTAESWSRVK